MMKNKFWVIIIGYILIILFLGQLFTTTIYAEDLGDGGVGRVGGNFKQICFAEVICGFREATLENPSAEEYCYLSSIDSTVNEHGIIIEIISGGHFDSTRNHSFHVTEQSLFNGSDYYFYVGKVINRPKYVTSLGKFIMFPVPTALGAFTGYKFAGLLSSLMIG